MGDVQSNSNDVLLSIQDLHVWYELKRFGFGHAGFVKAVDGVSFDLRQGDAMACVGESGCGKSSLMKTIIGLNRPTKWEIVFDDMKLTETEDDDLRAYRSKIGYVQQDPFGALPPFMTIQRILEEPLVINGIKDKKERMERIRKALTEVKLTPIEEVLPKYPHMLSGGQQQRVVIARAMILEPQLLVADEPVSMLDASVRVEILKLLRGLQESHNLAVIYITHDLSTVRYFSEYIFVMYAGEIVEIAEMEKLLTRTRVETPERSAIEAGLKRVEQMEQFSQQLDYEQAAQVRDRIDPRYVLGRGKLEDVVIRAAHRCRRPRSGALPRARRLHHDSSWR